MKTSQTLEKLRADCRLLYHLTQIPLLCRDRSGTVLFSYPTLEGLELLHIPRSPEEPPSGKDFSLPWLSPKDMPCLLGGFEVYMDGQYYSLNFGPSLFYPITVLELVQVFPQLNALDSPRIYSLLSSLPVAEPEYFCELLSLSYSLFFGITIKPSAVWEANKGDSFDQIPASTFQNIHNRRESAEFHTPYAYEKKWLTAVRTGNLAQVEEALHDLNLTGKPGILSKDPLRHTKNLFIAMITQITRAAIEGGVLEELAYSMSDSYINEAEKSRTAAALATLQNRAAYDFTTAVSKIRGLHGYSPAIRKTLNFLSRHVQEKITLEDLAKAAGLSTSRLSHLFRQETGLSPIQYLNREKIETAQNMLTTFGYSISDISMILSYSSQSHFISAFKKQTGMTPKQYRDQK